MSDGVKHTPEEWVACGSEDTLATWVQDGAGRRVCTMRKCEQDWQRAQLIAASLELLAACKSALHLLQTYCEPESLGGEHFDLSDAKAVKPLFDAIAKAEGRK